MLVDLACKIKMYSDATSQSSGVSASKALEGLLKITHDKLCECSRFSTLSSLVRITHLSICLSAIYTS